MGQVILIFLLAATPLLAGPCPPAAEQIEADISSKARDLFLLDDTMEVKFVESIDQAKLPRTQRVALFEFITEDRIFGPENPHQRGCPDSRIRIYRVRTQDEHRLCSGIMRLQLPAGIYDVVHLNCGR
jgi:hypothetical protein